MAYTDVAMVAPKSEPQEPDTPSLCAKAEAVLDWRKPEEVKKLVDKLEKESIFTIDDLLRVSKQTIERKLESNADFNLRDVGDVGTLRDSLDSPGRARNPRREDNRRSRGKGGNRSRSPRGGKGQGDRGGGRNNRGDRERRQRSPLPSKPDLWAAVEEGHLERVKQLIREGKDPEERHRGWTPLMKASEEGHVEIITALLDARVDIEATNRNGRTALSFAAAPSMKRPTPVSALRLLLSMGANVHHKDERSCTAKDMAEKENRAEAVSMMDEFAAESREAG